LLGILLSTWGRFLNSSWIVVHSSCPEVRDINPLSGEKISVQVPAGPWEALVTVEQLKGLFGRPRYARKEALPKD
jgi:hypothetical protein